MNCGKKENKLPIIMGIIAMALAVVAVVIAVVSAVAKKPGTPSAEVANESTAEVPEESTEEVTKEVTKEAVEETSNVPVINLNDYLTVYAEGYNTIGYAICDFDWERFEADYGEEIEDIFDSDIGFMGEFDEWIDLTNGDKNKFTWTVNDEMALDRFGYKVQYEDIDFTVSGLIETTVIHPWQKFEVGFEGVDGDGHAFIKAQSTAPYAKNLVYSFDKDSELKNGDSIKVFLSGSNGEDDEDAFYESFGFVPDYFVHCCTVSGLEPSDYDSIPADDTIPDEGQIFPSSSYEIIDPARIKELSDEDLRYAINEIYARNGYIFNNTEMAEYYGSLSWYEPSVKAADFSVDRLNLFEQQNMQEMQKERNSRKS